MDCNYDLDRLTREGVLSYDGASYLNGHSTRPQGFAAALYPSNKVVQNKYLRNSEYKDSFKFSDDKNEKKQTYVPSKKVLTGGIVGASLLFVGYKIRHSKIGRWFAGDNKKAKSADVATFSKNAKKAKNTKNAKNAKNAKDIKFFDKVKTKTVDLFNKAKKSFNKIPKAGKIAIGVGAAIVGFLGIKAATEKNAQKK